MRRSFLFYVPLIILFLSCKDAEKDRGDEEEIDSEVSQPVQRTVNASDTVVPEGYKIEAIVEGLTYPVDITLDEDGNYHMAEADGHTYGTRSPRAPEARMLKVAPNMKPKVFYDRVVPMTEIKEEESSADMDEELIPPVTGVTFYQGSLYISHRSRYSVNNLETGEFETITNGLPSCGEFLNAKPILKDDKMYWFLSTQGNSGVIEEHWVRVIEGEWYRSPSLASAS